VGLWDWVTATLLGERPSYPSVGSPPAAISPLPEESDSATACATLEQDSPEEACEPPWWRPSGADLLGLTGLPRPELSSEARALENLLILHFDGRNLALPSLPHAPEQILRILDAKECGLGRVAQEIGKDQVAAAAVLQLANSPLYRGLVKVTAIEPAVVRLGVNAIRMAMLNLSMRSIAFRERRKGSNRAESLWHRALAAGTVMRALSGFTGLNPEEAFLIGLLHDIGNVIVLRIANAQPPGARLETDDEAFEYLCEEGHQEFGELLADAWSLPLRLKTLIADHHTYPAADQPFRCERLQLHLTDMICALLGFAPFAPYALEESRAVCDLGLLDRADFESFLAALPGELEQTLASLT